MPKHLLYVTDDNNGPGGGGEILVYSASLRAKNQQPIRTITSGADRWHYRE